MIWELRRIKWLDSNNRAEWHNPQLSEYGPLEIETIGYVIHEDKVSVTLAASVVMGSDDQVADAMTIPTCCIKSQKTVRRAKNAR